MRDDGVTSELRAVGDWFLSEHADRWNAVERVQRYEVIEKAAAEVTGEAYLEYLKTVNAGDGPEHTLERLGVIAYLRWVTARAMEQVRAARVTRGVKIWHFYNMGYVIKTPRSCFGIDLHFRGAEKLAGDLDFLLTTHEHVDHWTGALLEAMAAAGKPVVTRFFEKGRIVREACVMRLGEVEVKIGIGDHHWYQGRAVNDMLVFDIDCGESTGGVRVVHCGDNSNVEKLPVVGGREVDALMFHIRVGLSGKAAWERLRPRVLFPAHVLELGHSVGHYRWSFADAMEVVNEIPPEGVRLLTWGESVQIVR